MSERSKQMDQIVYWLQQRVTEAHADGLMVGLSGGLDSAVVAFLIKRAFPDSSLGVIMPCHSNPKDKEDALKVVEASGIEHLLINLSDTHDLLLGKVQKQLHANGHLRQETAHLIDGNLRARLRMSTLYAVANNYNYLVVGTDNAAEWYTGYFTKYGDGGVDVQPLARLLKREVFRWGEELGVPQSILDRTPSAGLWVGQDDESEMGTTYDMIDDLLIGKDIPQAERQSIERMHARTAHKRSTPPIPPELDAE